MDNEKRDRQFQNFAHAVYIECTNIYQEAMLSGLIDANQRVIRHMARRAYDLVGHTVDYIDPKDLDMLERHECIERIPDLIELPKEEL